MPVFFSRWTILRWFLVGLRILALFALLSALASQFHSETLRELSLPLAVMIWPWIGFLALCWMGKSIDSSRKSKSDEEAFARAGLAVEQMFAAPKSDKFLLKWGVSNQVSSPCLCRFPFIGSVVLFPRDYKKRFSRDELLFVMAHEIAHFALRNRWHHAFKWAIFVLSTAAVISMSFMTQRHSDEVLYALIASWISARLFSAPISRQAEKLADRVAARACVAMKIDPVECAQNALNAYLPEQVKSGLRSGFLAWREPIFFEDDHPLNNIRIDLIRSEAKISYKAIRDNRDVPIWDAVLGNPRNIGKISTVGRNAACPCGSGKKFQYCCGASDPRYTSCSCGSGLKTALCCGMRLE